MDRKLLDRALKYTLLTFFLLYTLFFLMLIPKFYGWWRKFQVYSASDDPSGINQLIHFIVILLIPFIPFYLNWFFYRIRERNNVLPYVFYGTVILTLLVLIFIIIYFTAATDYFPKMHCEMGMDSLDVCKYGWYKG